MNNLHFLFNLLFDQVHESTITWEILSLKRISLKNIGLLLTCIAHNCHIFIKRRYKNCNCIFKKNQRSFFGSSLVYKPRRQSKWNLYKTHTGQVFYNAMLGFKCMKWMSASGRIIKETITVFFPVRACFYCCRLDEIWRSAVTWFDNWE